MLNRTIKQTVHVESTDAGSRTLGKVDQARQIDLSRRNSLSIGQQRIRRLELLIMKALAVTAVAFFPAVLGWTDKCVMCRLFVTLIEII